jgi:hypothetical protein
VAANMMRMEVVAIALPVIVTKRDGMIAVLAVESYREIFEVNTSALLCVTLGLFDLADHAVIHCVLLICLELPIYKTKTHVSLWRRASQLLKYAADAINSLISCILPLIKIQYRSILDRSQAKFGALCAIL